MTDKRPEESNIEYCERLAREHDKDKLITQLLKLIHEAELKKTRSRRFPLWSIIANSIGHGSGVSSAIVELYYPEGNK